MEVQYCTLESEWKQRFVLNCNYDIYNLRENLCQPCMHELKKALFFAALDCSIKHLINTVLKLEPTLQELHRWEAWEPVTCKPFELAVPWNNKIWYLLSQKLKLIWIFEEIKWENIYIYIYITHSIFGIWNSWYLEERNSCICWIVISADEQMYLPLALGHSRRKISALATSSMCTI